MPELTAADLEAFTQGRLAEDDDETERCLNAALSAARRYCGWHVTPVLEDDEVTLDGPGSALLVLPTLRLVELTALTEDGADIGLDYVSVSARGLVRKKPGYPGRYSYCHGWSAIYGGITATMTHGFTEEQAADWRSAVLSMADRAALDVGGGTPRVIGPFQYDTQPRDAERTILDTYRLELAP